MLAPQAVAGRFTAAQIHDTVAAIARQRQYAVPVRESILGRLFLSVIRWFRDLFILIKAWPDAPYLLIVAVVLLILIVAGRILIDRRTKASRAAGAGLRALGGEARDYWALAAQLDASGHYLEACHAVYLAALDTITRSGLVRYHASKTSGDYARELRRRGSPLAGDFASFARQSERCMYGWSPPMHDDYVQLSRAAEPFIRGRAAA
jgi:uncharacterized protein DUF4129